jgi:hypothetical protein
MCVPIETKVEQLRGLFEGREAIYVEKGALNVRVGDIRRDITRLTISAEEIFKNLKFKQMCSAIALASCPDEHSVKSRMLGLIAIRRD